MEFQIRNKYIKKFLSKHPNNNELKVVKYLTILGINLLEQNNKNGISFDQLKIFASIHLSHICNLYKTLIEDISSKFPKEEKVIKNEIITIKNELLKLNQRFEEKLKYITSIYIIY